MADLEPLLSQAASLVQEMLVSLPGNSAENNLLICCYLRFCRDRHTYLALRLR